MIKLCVTLNEGQVHMKHARFRGSYRSNFDDDVFRGIACEGHRQTDRQTNKPPDRQKETQTGRQIDRQTDRQTDRLTVDYDNICKVAYDSLNLKWVFLANKNQSDILIDLTCTVQRA